MWHARAPHTPLANLPSPAAPARPRPEQRTAHHSVVAVGAWAPWGSSKPELSVPRSSHSSPRARAASCHWDLSARRRRRSAARQPGRQKCRRESSTSLCLRLGRHTPAHEPLPQQPLLHTDRRDRALEQVPLCRRVRTAYRQVVEQRLQHVAPCRADAAPAYRAVDAPAWLRLCPLDDDDADSSARDSAAPTPTSNSTSARVT